LFPLCIGAEENKPVIGFVPFTIEGIGAEEARIIESLIHSYIADQGDVIEALDASVMMFSLSDTGGVYNTAAGEARQPDYTLSGSINMEGDNRILMLEISKTSTGEKVNYTSVHKSASELILKAKSLVAAVLSAGTGAEDFQEAVPETLTETAVLGTWRGDTGVELIRLQRGGVGIAILSSGAQMSLEYTIENNILRVSQRSPNTERFYHPLPYGVAKQLALQAEPMKWELLLYDGGTALRGMKIATAVQYDRDAIIEIFPGTAREAEWLKASP
jgi:hypothetical protein